MSYITRQPRGAANGHYESQHPDQDEDFSPPQSPFVQGQRRNGSTNINESPYLPASPEFPDSPPPYVETQKSESKDKLSFNEAFLIEQPKWNDIWATILFSLICLGFLAVSGLAISGYKNDNNGDSDNGTSLSLDANTTALLALILSIAFLLSTVYFIMVRCITKQIIYITVVLQVLLGLATAVAYFVRHRYAFGSIFLAFSLFYIFCFFSWRSRIPFSILMLQTVIDVSKSYGHVFLVSSIGGIITTAFAVYFSITLVGIYAKYHPGGPSCDAEGGCSVAKVAGLTVFITFAAFWITEVIKNVIHVTISGVYGSWYFCSQKPSGFPSGATIGAFRRASTYSFGSISFGSLVVAIIKFLRHLCSMFQAQERLQGNVVGVILGFFAGFFIGLLDWIVQFINEYAFSYIALYGKAYVPAAKDTWRMLRSRGVDALVNECIANQVLTMGAIFIGYICAFLAFLYMEVTQPSYNSNGGYTPVVMAASFILGLQICNVFLAPIKSGISTFFVAMAFDPEVLKKDFPDLYEKMVALHPKVRECVQPDA